MLNRRKQLTPQQTLLKFFFNYLSFGLKEEKEKQIKPKYK